MDRGVDVEVKREKCMDKCVKWRAERMKRPFDSGQTAKRMRRYPLPGEAGGGDGNGR